MSESYTLRLKQLALDRQLVSVMNRTKWRELVDILDSNSDFAPKTRIKYLDGDSAGEFSHLDSYLVKFGGSTRAIEWLEIDPIRRDYIGRLVTEQKIDFSGWIRKDLTSYSIPFIEIDGLFRINGYLQPAES